MNIAFILPSLANKGPIIFTKNLVEGLTAEGMHCEVFYFDPILELDFPVRCTQISFWKKNAFEKFDIVHSTMAKPDCYIAYHRLTIKPPCLTSMHCFMMDDLRQLRGRTKSIMLGNIWKWALNRIDNIIVSSEAMRKYYIEQLGLSDKTKYAVIPYGIPYHAPTKVDDEQVIEILQKLKEKYIVLVGCGSLIKRKGFSQLINYLPSNQQVALVLIGDGECKEELSQQALSLGVGDRVCFLGFKTNSFNFYPYCDIFCMSSNSEGFGLAMLEAMSQGMPIVASNLEIYQDFFTEHNISLFEYSDAQSLAHAIERVIAQRQQYSEGSKELFEQKFSLSAMSLSHIELYKHISDKYTQKQS